MGISISLILIAVGAILTWAVTASVSGIDLNVVGVILMIVKTRIEASRLLIYNAAMAKERSKTDGRRYSQEASMAKLFASETAMFVHTRQSRFMAEWATAGSCPWSAISGMPRSPRSMKGQARSSGWSFRGVSSG